VGAGHVLEVIVVRERHPQAQEGRALAGCLAGPASGASGSVAVPVPVVVTTGGLVEVLRVAKVWQALAGRPRSTSSASTSRELIASARRVGSSGRFTKYSGASSAAMWVLECPWPRDAARTCAST
jgi:hypothetical protein